MKIIIFSIILLLASTISNAQNRKIEFETGNFAELKAKAKKENKLIFIDAYTTWCGPCKWMAANIFTNDTVADYYNSNLINAKIDMEKGEGIEIAKTYNVQCYPTYLFLDGDGNLVHRLAGSRSSQEFIEVAKTAAKPEERFSHFVKDYESKKNNSEFLIEYMEALASTCLDFENILNDYFSTQKESDLATPKNWKLLFNYTSNHKSKEFVYLLNNLDTFQKKYTKDSVDMKIKNVLMASGQKIIYNQEAIEKDFSDYKKEVLAMKTNQKDAVIFELNLMYYESKEEWKNFVDLVVAEGDKYFNTLQQFNSVSWTIYEKSDDMKALSKAEGWMRKALSGNTNPNNWYCYDTYAAILFKLKRKDQARDNAKKAIAMAKEIELTEEDYKGTTDLLKEIEKLK